MVILSKLLTRIQSVLMLLLNTSTSKFKYCSTWALATKCQWRKVTNGKEYCQLISWFLKYLQSNFLNCLYRVVVWQVWIHVSLEVVSPLQNPWSFNLAIKFWFSAIVLRRAAWLLVPLISFCVGLCVSQKTEVLPPADWSGPCFSEFPSFWWKQPPKLLRFFCFVENCK